MPGSGLVRRSSASASEASRSAARRASSSSTHGVETSGVKTISVPAVRQPSHGCGLGSSAWRSARTTTGCCWRMRSSIRFIGSSKERSSRNSEKSKPSSSLTGTKTAASENSVWSVLRPISSTVPGACGGSPRSRKPRHAWPPGGSVPPISVSKNPWPRISSLARPNSSSAGSDHLETAPCASVRTKYPPTICRSSASSASGGSAPSATPASTASGVLEGGVVEGFMGRVLRGRGLVRLPLHRQMQPFVQQHGRRARVQ